MAERDVKKGGTADLHDFCFGKETSCFSTTPAMECLQGRIPYASWRRRALLCLLDSYADANGSRVSAYRGFSTLRSAEQREVTNTTTEPEEPRLAARPSDSLPRSPIAAQQKFEKKRKQQPKPADLLDLRRNPWAMALASPVRMCAITRTRLPRDFLGGWGLIQRPDDMEKLWLMPVELLKDELKTSVQHDSPRTSTPFNYLRLRILNSLPMLRKLSTALSRATGGKRSAIARIIPQRWKPPFGPMTSLDERRMVWRHDMPEFVLGHMRKETMKRLKAAISKHDVETDALASRVWTAVELRSAEELEEASGRIVGVRDMRRGALLTMGLQSTTLPEYVMLSQTQSRVPVLDLTALLSESDLADLKTQDHRFQSTALFFRPDDPLTADALLHLWKLQGFLRHDSLRSL